MPAACRRTISTVALHPLLHYSKVWSSSEDLMCIFCNALHNTFWLPEWQLPYECKQAQHSHIFAFHVVNRPCCN